MELFRQINNEALDEDNKIRRQVVERLKKQVALFNQPYKAPAELSDITYNNFQRFVINFDDTLNKTLNDAYGKEEKDDTGDLILNYNLLANYLDKINFNLLGAIDKKEIMEILDELIPKIGKILSIIKSKDYKDVDLVEKVFNNFKNHTYNVILEKERVGIEREAVRKAEIEALRKAEIEGKPEAKREELDLSQLSPKERQIKQLEIIVKKAEAINEKIRLPSNSTILKARNEARTFLQQIEKGREDLGRLNKFLRTELDKVNKKYDAVFKPVVEKVAQAQEQEEDKPEEGLTMAPLLQQGAEETTATIPAQTFPLYEGYEDTTGYGKPKKYKKN